MRPRIFALIIIVALLSTLSLAVVVDAQDTITINFWRPSRAPESDPPAIWDDTGELIQMWNEANPTIQVNIESIPFNDLDTKQLTALRAGSTDVDVLLVNHVTIGAAIGTGGLMPLDDCIASQPTMVADDWIPGLYAVGQLDGSQYTVPFDTDTRVMYYNKPLLEQAGVGVPTTWEELYAAMDAIQALGTDASPYYFTGANKWFVLYHSIGPWLVQKEASFLTPDGSASATLDEGTVEAWKHAVRLGKYAPESALASDGADLSPLFTQGKMGFLFTGVWMELDIDNYAPEWQAGVEYDVALIPGPTGGATGSTNGGFHMAIAAASEHADEACAFVAWATSPEVMAVATKDHIPTRVSAQETEFFQDYIGDNYITKLSLEQSLYGRPPVAGVTELPEIADLVLRQFNRAVVGEVTDEEALAELDQEITDLLAKR